MQFSPWVCTRHGASFTHQWPGTSPRILETQDPPTSSPINSGTPRALAPETPGWALSNPAHVPDQGVTKQLVRTSCRVPCALIPPTRGWTRASGPPEAHRLCQCPTHKPAGWHQGRELKPYPAHQHANSNSETPWASFHTRLGMATHQARSHKYLTEYLQQ